MVSMIFELDALALSDGRSTARALRGANGDGDGLCHPCARWCVRWPRSRPRASMSAPIASETRNPFNASNETMRTSCRPESGRDEECRTSFRSGRRLTRRVA